MSETLTEGTPAQGFLTHLCILCVQYGFRKSMSGRTLIFLEGFVEEYSFSRRMSIRVKFVHDSFEMVHLV